MMTGRDLPAIESAASTIITPERSISSHQLDVSDPTSVQDLGDWIADQYGSLDIVVNNAAVHYDDWQRATDADLGVVQEAFTTNTLGPWRVIKATLPALRNSPHGRIVNVSSEGGSISKMTGGTPAYSVSKAALNALTRLLAGELASDNILVNAICPGWTNTDMGQGGRPVADGAAGVVWAATLPDNRPTGGFFRDQQVLSW